MDVKLPEGEPACRALAQRAAQMVTRFTQILGPCPRKSLKIDAGLSSLPVPGNFAPGIIRVSEEVLLFDGPSGFSPTVLPFEIARQWFPNVGMSSRLYSPGMAELVAQYLAWRYVLETNVEAARVTVAEAARDSVALAPSMSLSEMVSSFSGPTFASGKEFDQRGLLIMRTLETVIDRERVDRVLPLYLRRYSGHASSAPARDFEKACEEVAGRDLSWFFRYYFDEKSVPEIELRRVPSESPGVAAGEIIVKGLPREGSVRVEMTVRTAEGVVEHSVATRGRVTPFTVNVPSPALGITLDPDLRILRWTEAARRSKAQSRVLAALPTLFTRADVPDAIQIYQRALAADPEDSSLHAQGLRERLGELEWAHGESGAALLDLDAAIAGHSISPFETYLWRGKAYLYRGVVQLHEGRSKEALEDARAGLALPRLVLLQEMPADPVESHGNSTLEHLLEALSDAASRP